MFIMDGLIDHGYGGKELRKLNYCRMWQKVITISDMITTDRNKIKETYLKGNGRCKFRERIKWPRDPPEIPRSWWNLWKIAIRSTFCIPLTDNKINYNIGNWKNNNINKWKWWKDNNKNHIYKK